MERHKCKLCLRNFANGRALGGHMRSHIMNVYAVKEKEEDEYDLFSSSSSQEDDDDDDPKQSPFSSRRSKRVKKSIILRDEDVAYCMMMMSKDKCGVERVYRCETCGRSFWSYQALGGHRASHNKIKVDVAAATAEEKKVHECPFCGRVFASGQALGGHKRSHFIAASTIKQNLVKRISRNCGHLDIDLNLPPPIHDDDDSH